MKINSITRLIIMSAMTCFSTAALADVTPHSNTDSVDFAANMTVQGKQCPLTVTKTGDIGFTYTYTQDDADAGALGDMAVDSPDASVTVSTSEGCQIHTLSLTSTSRTGLIKVAKNTAALPTHNAGFIPFVAQLANITFSDGTETRTARFVSDFGQVIRSATEQATESQLEFGGHNTDTKINGENVLGVSGLQAGHMRFNGLTDHVEKTDWLAVRSGLLDLKGPNNQPQSPGFDPHLNLQWYPEVTSGEAVDPDFSAVSCTLTFTAMVGTTVYNLANKSPDPDAVYDNESLSTTATYTFTAI